MDAQAALPPKKEKVLTVEFWRFFFTVFVCLYHLEIYFARREVLVSGTSAVEFFFVLAGFLMAMSAKRDLAGRMTPVTVREAHLKAVDFVKKKLKAIYPVLIVVMLLWLAVSPAAPNSSKLQMLLNTEWEWLLLVGTPFGLNNGMAMNIPMWFLTALLVVGYIYTFAIYKNYDFVMFAAPVVGVLCYVFFALNSTALIDHSAKMGFLNGGMVRAFAEMSFGVCVFCIYERLSQKELGLFWRILLSLLEVYAIYRFFALTLWQPIGLDNFRRIVYVMIIVLLSFLNTTALARALKNRFSRRLGEISFAMYMCHYILIPVYFQLLNFAKTSLWRASSGSALARRLLDFLQGTGGMDSSFRPIPITWKDAVLFSLLVIAVSVLITLYIAGVRKYCVRPLVELIRETRAEKAAACAGSQGEKADASTLPRP